MSQPVAPFRAQPRLYLVHERTVRVALEDSAYAFLPERSRSFYTTEGERVEILPASQFEDHPFVADLHLRADPRTARDRHVVFITRAGEVFEHDDRGLIYRDGARLWSTPLVEFGRPRRASVDTLATGEEAALLFLSRSAAGTQLRIHMTRPLVLLVADPPTRPRSVCPDWLTLAGRSLIPYPESA